MPNPYPMVSLRKPGPAERYFSVKECNATQDLHTPEELIEFLENLETDRSDALPAGTVFYRGQSNSINSLSSSLYRLCRESTSDRVTEALIGGAEQAILKTMRDEGLGRLMTDLELLQVLQHHGIPTRLIDVSTHPLEALFFAVDRNDATPGRMFVIRLDALESGRRLLEGGESGRLPWAEMARATQADSRWTNCVALIDADPLDPRMRAQRGKFLVGGLNCAYGGRGMEGVDSQDFADVTTLGINFKQPMTTQSNQAWPATGWTITIPAEWKPSLRRLLAGQPESIRWDTMYPPVGEVSRLAKFAATRKVQELTNSHH